MSSQSQEAAPQDYILAQGTKEYLKYLSEQDADSIRDVAINFPISQSTDVIFANLTDRKKYNIATYDLGMSLLTQKARLPRNLKTQSQYWLAKSLVDVRLTRSIGSERDRVLASTMRQEQITTQQARPASGIRRLLRI